MNIATNVLLFILLFILIIFSAFFSAAETAYTSINPAKIQLEHKKETRIGRLLQKHIKSFSWTFSTILLVNNLVNIGASVLTSYLLSDLLYSKILSIIISVIVITPVIVIFGELVPKMIARKYSFGYLKRIVLVMEVLNWFFLPLTYPISKIHLSSGPTNTENELKEIIDVGSQEGIIEKREATLTKNALDLDSKKVDDAYTLTKKIILLTQKQSLDDAKTLFNYSGYSRLPFIQGQKWMGVVHLKDIAFIKTGKPKDFIHKTPFISKNTILTKALEIMRFSKSHILFVTSNNKSKTPIGIITLEDIIEELIGKIYDEHDITDSVRELDLHKWTSEGNTTMKKINDLIGHKFEDSNPKETLYHWLSLRINRRIKTNLIYVYKNKYKFKIISNRKGEETQFEITEK